MDHPESGRRSWLSRRGNAGTLTALAVALVVAVAVGRGARPLVAQAAAKVDRLAAAAGPHVYLQTQVGWPQIDGTLTQWEAKGWETFQIVPIANPNPATGGTMQVALIFRRPAPVGK
jgi:hypothetical protein